MKKNITKKLRNYSLLAGATLVIGASAHAQNIVYTDIEDETINSLGESIIIDFNNDNVIDMQVNIMTFQGIFGSDQATAIRAMVPPLGIMGGLVGNSVLLNEYVAAALDSNYAIDADKSFEYNGWPVDMAEWWNSTGGDAGTAGNWMGTVEEKFLGVKFKIGSDTHFGWIRVSTIANAADDLTATVHDYAYEQASNTQILTGATGLTQVNEIKSQTNIFPNPTSGIIQINAKINTNVVVKDLTGKILFETTEKTIDMSEYGAGVYIISLNNGIDIENHKIIVE